MYFQDATGFIVPDKIGRQRLNVLKSKFVEHGGKLIESMSTTRGNLVIVDETLDDRGVAGLAVKSVFSIKFHEKIFYPDSKATFVKCSWISDCVKQRKRLDMDAYIVKRPPDCHPNMFASAKSADVVDLAVSDDETSKAAKRPRRQFVCETSSRRTEEATVEDVKEVGIKILTSY
jgi:hypothetical protein